ncbi:MAG TPA: PA2169 family four-helix-bundle protein [Bryobacteraceae bacterium]
MAELIDTLNDLIATCRDSEEGFGKAAKGVHSDNLRTRFTGIAARRAEFADELAGCVQEVGGKQAESAHVSSIQHKGWRDLEESSRPKSDALFLKECETGEENTLRHYEQALTVDLTPRIRAVVERQRLAVQETLLELRSVEQV